MRGKIMFSSVFAGNKNQGEYTKKTHCEKKSLKNNHLKKCIIYLYTCFIYGRHYLKETSFISYFLHIITTLLHLTLPPSTNETSYI